jgi:DNA-binding LytR/AlgR family response regulator
MRIAVVEDQAFYQKQMSLLCHEFGSQHHTHLEIDLFSDGEAFLRAFHPGSYSIVFMDIYLKEMNGVDVAKQMRGRDPNSLLVFMTSSDAHMPEAFSCHAFEYITKPFSAERLFQVLQDALSHLPESSSSIEIICDHQLTSLSLQELLSVTSDLHYLKFEMTDGTIYRSRMTMSAFCPMVAEDSRFILVNRGILLNADYIVSIDHANCVLADGRTYPMRVRDRASIERAIQDYRNGRLHCTGS